MVYGLELKKKIKKVTHSGSNKPMVGFIGTFHRYCVLGHSANAEDTILAGRSAASSLRFFVESIATDHQEVSSFFFREKNRPFEVSNPRPGA